MMPFLSQLSISSTVYFQCYLIIIAKVTSLKNSWKKTLKNPNEIHQFTKKFTMFTFVFDVVWLASWGESKMRINVITVK
jgi:hypothetical protein